MVLVPCVRSNANGDPVNAVFRELRFYHELPAELRRLEKENKIQFTTFPSDDGGCHPTKIDTRMIDDPKDSKPAVLSALRASPTRSGYLVFHLRPGEKVGGASLGLATAVELISPGRFPRIAFTGFVTELSERDGTCRIHEVDHVIVKLTSALEKRIPLCVPWGEQIEHVAASVGMLTPKLATSLPVERGMWRCMTAYSLLEALTMATMFF